MSSIFTNRAALAALLFGFATNLQNLLTILKTPIPSEFMLMLPYVVTILAVAGFAADDLSVELRDGAVIVAAKKAETEGERAFLHRGIANRAFERRFTLAEHIRVEGASHRDGMLHIELIREVPETLKPRQIAIERIETAPRVGKLDA